MLIVGVPATAEKLWIGTASLGGAFYPMGQSISNIVTQHSGDGISMVPIATGGSVHNLNLIADGEVEIAITTNNLAGLADSGKGPYSAEGEIDVGAVAALHPSARHMMVLVDSDINGQAGPACG